MTGIGAVTAFGALCLGAVGTFATVDRLALSRSTDVRRRVTLAARLLVLGAGLVAVTVLLAGIRAVPWLAAGSAMSGLIRFMIARRGDGYGKFN